MTLFFERGGTYKGDMTLEERIQRSENRWQAAAKAWAISYFILAVGIASALYGVWVAGKQDAERASASRQALCENSNQARTTVRNFMLTLVERSDGTLDSLTYYQQHPKELKAAHEANAKTKEQAETQLQNVPCTKITNP